MHEGFNFCLMEQSVELTVEVLSNHTINIIHGKIDFRARRRAVKKGKKRKEYIYMMILCIYMYICIDTVRRAL